MTSSYLKSLSGDFTQGLKLEQFHQEIVNAAGITPVLIGISQNLDEITIEFQSALSAGELTTLDTLISAHTPNYNKIRSKNFVVYPKRNSIKTTKYTLSHAFEYMGSDQIGTINYIDLMAYIDSNTNTYDVRVINSTTGQVLVEKTGLNNTSLAVIDLGTISNIPSLRTTLELQVKRNGTGSKSIELEQLIVYYDN